MYIKAPVKISYYHYYLGEKSKGKNRETEERKRKFFYKLRGKCDGVGQNDFEENF